MNLRYIAGAMVATALAVPTIVLSAPEANAKHGGASVVRTSGDCAATTNWKLKAKPDNGRLEVEFEVDARRKGQRWSVTLADNGVTVWSGSRVTKGRSASFSVEKRIANQAGADAITASAVNLRTGETCTGTLTYSR